MSPSGIKLKGVGQLPPGTPSPSKPASNPERPQVNERAQKIQELLEQQVNGLDAFVDAGQETMDAVVERLKSALPQDVQAGDTQDDTKAEPKKTIETQDLQAAFRAMRTYAVVKMLKPEESRKVSDSLQLFCTLWLAANEKESREGKAAPANPKVNLDFGDGFDFLIKQILRSQNNGGNDKGISLSTRK